MSQDEQPVTIAESIRRKIAEIKSDPTMTWPKVSDDGSLEQTDALVDTDKTRVSDNPFAAAIRQKIDLTEAEKIRDEQTDLEQVDARSESDITDAEKAEWSEASWNPPKKSSMTNSKTNIRQFVRVLAPGTRLGAYEIIEEIAEDSKATTYSAKQVNFDIAVNIVVPKVATKEAILEFHSWIKKVSKGEIMDSRGTIVDTGLNGLVVYAVMRNNKQG